MYSLLITDGALADSIETLSCFPKRFKKLELNLKEETLRELTIKHYLIIYKIDNESVIVLRVLYSSSSIR